MCCANGSGIFGIRAVRLITGKMTCPQRNSIQDKKRKSCLKHHAIYRSIALLSHARKAIEAATAIGVQPRLFWAPAEHGLRDFYQQTSHEWIRAKVHSGIVPENRLRHAPTKHTDGGGRVESGKEHTNHDQAEGTTNDAILQNHEPGATSTSRKGTSQTGNAKPPIIQRVYGRTLKR